VEKMKMEKLLSRINVIWGKTGSGKTTLLNTITNSLSNLGKSFIYIKEDRMPPHKNLSFGQRNIEFIKSAIQQLDKGAWLIVDNPEIALDPETYDNLLEFLISAILEKDANLVITSYSSVPIHTIRKFILSNKLLPSDVKYYYLPEKSKKPLELRIDEKGRPLLSPNFKDIFREYEILYLDRL
jgi:predicted ATPase